MNLLNLSPVKEEVLDHLFSFDEIEPFEDHRKYLLENFGPGAVKEEICVGEETGEDVVLGESPATRSTDGANLNANDSEVETSARKNKSADSGYDVKAKAISKDSKAKSRDFSADATLPFDGDMVENLDQDFRNLDKDFGNLGDSDDEETQQFLADDPPILNCSPKSRNSRQDLEETQYLVDDKNTSATLTEKSSKVLRRADSEDLFDDVASDVGSDGSYSLMRDRQGELEQHLFSFFKLIYLKKKIYSMFYSVRIKNLMKIKFKSQYKVLKNSI